MLRLPPVQGPDDEEPRGEPMNSFSISLVGVVDLFRRSTIPRQSSEMVRVRWRGCERRGTQPFVTLFLSTALGSIYLFVFFSLCGWLRREVLRGLGRVFLSLASALHLIIISS
ncbi:hypothetical protein BO82DRAFT_27050 [Aspergillus uvarum CBS 121591]|uniref:Uncharacterized protein n=1 Tax=Aspergillus uvarum CBS 121591 TaxID=1448315 RepID=A0A319D611_9EURO|nr:hypothetical protein BO82DRAFT_27050 [Aspergillus uvarum CBS 121591]PYH75462.1 hypothetical protein BO82DRAFT_27050 [Aspergillus uvarum CBS 121591]